MKKKKEPDRSGEWLQENSIFQTQPQWYTHELQGLWLQTSWKQNKILAWKVRVNTKAYSMPSSKLFPVDNLQEKRNQSFPMQWHWTINHTPWLHVFACFLFCLDFYLPCLVGFYFNFIFILIDKLKQREGEHEVQEGSEKGRGMYIKTFLKMKFKTR